MSSTSHVGLSYPSSHGNFVGRDGLEGMIDNGAHQYTTASALSESAQIESHQERVLQRLKELTAVKANIDAELQEFQNLYHKLEYARAQQSAHMPFTPTTTTSYVPFTTASPYSTTNSSPSFSQTADLSANQGETWNTPNRMPSPSTSQPSTAQYAQPTIHSPPKYPARNRTGKKVFRCECGHEASRKGDMKRHRESLRHVKQSYFCHCGKSFTRKDSLLRHELTHP